MYRFRAFDDNAYFGLLEEDNIPIHYLHDQEDTHNFVSSDDPIVAYWRRHLAEHGRTRTGGKGSGTYRGTNN